MALSQKHYGKILVPWFNSHEWRYVYTLLYSETSGPSERERAAEILQIWKIRMPILFAGVEGTLTILNAMLLDETVVPREELTSLYGLAIMRFLNLCAANSDQQGTFFRVAKEKNLPEWLVSIRHDIAHSQRKPSMFMLKKGLEYCFKWLKQEYWEKQDKEIKDFIIPEVVLTNIDEKINLYCEFVNTTINKGKPSPAVIHMLRELKKNKNSRLIEVLRKLLRNNKSAIKKISDLVIENECLFASLTEAIEKIPNAYIEGWEPLFQYLHEHDMLLKFIRNMHGVCINNNDHKIQKISSLWLNEIFSGLNMKMKYPNDHSEMIECQGNSRYTMNLRSPNEKFLQQLRTYANEAIDMPHIYFQNYFRNLMELCSYKKEFVADVSDILTLYFHPCNSSTMDYVPMTVDNVKEVIPNEVFKQLNIENEIPARPKKVWVKIEDTDIYEGCPIGVLPHQSRDKNPTIKF